MFASFTSDASFSKALKMFLLPELCRITVLVMEVIGER